MKSRIYPYGSIIPYKSHFEKKKTKNTPLTVKKIFCIFCLVLNGRGFNEIFSSRQIFQSETISPTQRVNFIEKALTFASIFFPDHPCHERKECVARRNSEATKVRSSRTCPTPSVSDDSDFIRSRRKSLFIRHSPILQKQPQICSKIPSFFFI